MALEGTLRDFSLADILQLISLQNKTGLLALKSASDVVTLGFMDGRLVSAESSARRIDTRLGTVLVKTGRLKPENLQKALEIQTQTLQRLGYILLRNSFCTADDLRDGLDIQIRKIVYSLFRWGDGDYSFEQLEKIDYDQEFVTPILVESLLMEGARMIDEWPIIERVVTSMELVFQRKPVAQPVIHAESEEADEIGDSTLERRAREKRAGPIKITDKEWAVYQLVDGEKRVSEVLEQLFLSEFDGCKAFYDLISRGLIEQKKVEPVQGKKRETPLAALGAAREVKAVAFLAAAAVAALVSAGYQHRNRLNLLPMPPKRIAVVEGFEKAVSLLRLRRLTEAVDTFYLTSGRFPETIDTLVNARFLSRDDLRDTWGRRYRYILQPDKYYLVGFDPDGKTDIDLFFSNNARTNQATTPMPPRGARQEIIVID